MIATDALLPIPPHLSFEQAATLPCAGVTAWNGTLALAWLGLAGWRMEQTGSIRFAVVAGFGIINAFIVGRLIFPGRGAT